MRRLLLLALAAAVPVAASAAELAEPSDPAWVFAGPSWTTADLSFRPDAEIANQRELGHEARLGWQVGVHLDQTVAPGVSLRLGAEFAQREFGFTEKGTWSSDGSEATGTRRVRLMTRNVELPLLLVVRPRLPHTTAGADPARPRPLSCTLGVQVGLPVGTWMDTELSATSALGPVRRVSEGSHIDPGTAVKLVAALGFAIPAGRLPVEAEVRYTLDLRDRLHGQDQTTIRAEYPDQPPGAMEFPVEDLREESLAVSLKVGI